MCLFLAMVSGSVVGRLYERWTDKRPNPDFERRMGVLTATGLIVGESLWGVVFAGIVAGSGSDAPLALVGEGFEPIALVAGVLLYFALAWFLYRSEEHTSELQSLMRISYAVFRLKKKTQHIMQNSTQSTETQSIIQ